MNTYALWYAQNVTGRLDKKIKTVMLLKYMTKIVETISISLRSKSKK